MKIPFTKAHGTGNDFIILLASECPAIIREPAFIRQVCARRTGVGADAVLILSDEAGYDYRMDYYNSDGSWETMCANGSRCAALFMHDRGLASKHISFITGDGPHDVVIVDTGQIRLKMTPPHYQSDWLDVSGCRGRHVDSGAAHFVAAVDKIQEDLMGNLAPTIRYDACFQPAGINVNFYRRLDDSTLEVLTYEKGIERLMLSCGSGSVAAAYHAAMDSSMASPITIQVPGGELTVSFDADWQEVWLSGPAVLLFTSAIDTGDLNGIS